MPNRNRDLSRRRALELGAGALAAATFPPSPRATGATAPQEGDLILETIPRSGEPIPAIGMGTWQTFDVGSNERERAALLEVLRLFHRHGGRVN
jgi:hypothetical protein